MQLYRILQIIWVAIIPLSKSIAFLQDFGASRARGEAWGVPGSWRSLRIHFGFPVEPCHICLNGYDRTSFHTSSASHEWHLRAQAGKWVSSDPALHTGGPLKACAKLRHECPFFAGTQQKLVAALLPLVATVILVIAGSALTGPSMNPAHAFSWNYFLQVAALPPPMSTYCGCIEILSRLACPSSLHPMSMSWVY